MQSCHTPWFRIALTVSLYVCLIHALLQGYHALCLVCKTTGLTAKGGSPRIAISWLLCNHTLNSMFCFCVRFFLLDEDLLAMLMSQDCDITWILHTSRAIWILKSIFDPKETLFSILNDILCISTNGMSEFLKIMEIGIRCWAYNSVL